MEKHSKSDWYILSILSNMSVRSNDNLFLLIKSSQKVLIANLVKMVDTYNSSSNSTDFNFKIVII